MTVETPDTRDESTVSAPDGLQVKQAGEGVRAALNPFAMLLLPTFTQEEYEADRAAPPAPDLPTVSSRGVTSGAWGGHRNGLIPASALTPVAFSNGKVAEQGAARALEAMNAAYKAETGRDISITDSYRSLDGQRSVARTKPNLAAKPGESVHGWGKAFDLNIKGDPQLKAWLDANGAKFGFVNPDWAKKSTRSEPWHWEYAGGGTPGASVRAESTSPAAGKVVTRARQFVGTPFKWGGAGPLGFDPSGFTQYVYREAGVNLPRFSYQQGAAGARVPLDALKPGDLVAWDASGRNNGADHIAIYIGNGQVIESPKPGATVRIASMNGRGGSVWGIAMNL